MENLPSPLKSPISVAPVLSYTVRPGQHSYARPGQTGELLEWWNLLRRRKWVLVLAAITGVLLAALITIPRTPVYEARTSLEVQDINQEFMNMKQVSPVADSNAINALSDLQTQIKILQSESLADRTLAQTKVALPACVEDPIAKSSFWRQALNFLKTSPKQSRNLLLTSAAKNIRVRAAGQTRIIEVLVESPDPKVACGFANVLVSQFIDQSIEARHGMAQRTGAWLGRELDGMRLKLEHSEDALQAYARQNGLVYNGDKQSVSEQKLYQIQTELSRAQADLVAKQSQYEMARSANLDTLPDVMNDTGLRALQAELTDLQRQKAELSATYKSGYSKSKRVDAQIASVQTALDRARKAIADRIANEYKEAQHHESLLAYTYAAQTRLVTQDSEKGVKYSILEHEANTNRQIYEAMLQRVKEASIASAMKPSNVRVIDAAKLPSRPFKPNLPLNAVMGFLIGGMLGVAGIVVMSHTDRSLQEPGDAASLLGVPELGVIPSTELRHNLPRRNPYRVLDADSPQSALLTTELTNWTGEPSLLADSFRGVVASIRFSSTDGAWPRVLVITSAGPAEGKTTASSNLAQAMAQINSKVLLIDADLRKPRIHKIFGLENESGLADLLRQPKLDENEAVRLVQHTAMKNLDVLTSGTSHSAPNLFFSPSMPDLIKSYKRRYDMVIIDTPPMLLVPDARMLGPIADAVVLIIRAGQTTRDAALAVQQRLAGDQTRVLGVVLNDWDPRKSRNGYYGYAEAYKDASGKKKRA